MKKWLKWALFAFIALMVIGAIFGKDEPKNATTAQPAQSKAVEDTAKKEVATVAPAQSVALDKDGNVTDILFLSELMTICQLDIQKSMKDPNSMKIDHSTAKAWKSDKGYRIGFKFDGKNSYGGTVNQTAVCEISKDKKLLAISVE